MAIAFLSSFAPLAHGAISDQSLDELARQLEPRVIEWRRDIHQHPELGNHEVRTAGLVAEQLRGLGLEVKTGVAHTGVLGLLRGGKPGATILLRADMDALPVTEQVDLPFKSTVTSTYRGETVGVMHACGHDSHTAMMLAIAQILGAVRKDLPGNVLFMFQPAEEGPPEDEEGGAPLMVKEGFLDTYRPEAAFAMHVLSVLNAGEIGYRSGPIWAASDRWRIMVTGRQTHGGKPWQGVDPIVAAAQIVIGLQSIVSRQVNITINPAVVSVGAIKGGIRNNIIPDDVEMIGTIRSFTAEQRADIFARVKRTAENIAAASGASATFEVAPNGNYVTVNNAALTEQVLPSLKRAAGADKVKIIPAQTGAEDFSYVSRQVPSFYFIVGSVPPGTDPATAPANHSPLFFLDESAMSVGVRSMLHVVVDYLQARAKGAKAPAP